MTVRTRIVAALVLAALIPMAVVLAVPLIRAGKRAGKETARRLDEARSRSVILIEKERAGTRSAADRASDFLAADHDLLAAVVRGPESVARPVAGTLANQLRPRSGRDPGGHGLDPGGLWRGRLGCGRSRADGTTEDRS